MHRLYLVTYDICAPDRLRKVFQTCGGFGQHIQYSIFLCTLTARSLAMLRLRLEPHLNHREDQVLIVDLGPAHDRARQRFQALGRPFKPKEHGAVIISGPPNPDP